MGLTHLAGPLNIGYANGTANPSNYTAIPISADTSPSVIFGGVATQDPRYGFRVGGGTEANALLGIGLGLGDQLVLDAVPSAVAINNIAVGANAVSGTNQVLVSATGAGITVLAAALSIPQTGNVVPQGSLAIDGPPALIFFGNNKSQAVPDPRTMIARAVSITATSGTVGGAFLVTGRDLYGAPQTEKITVASSPTGTVTTNGKKAFKFITSVTPQVTDAHPYSVGTADVYGFPLLSQEFPLVQIGWAGSPVTTSTGYVAAVSSTATNTTGDVRGTYATQSASNGTNVLQMMMTISPVNIMTMSGYFGVTPA